MAYYCYRVKPLSAFATPLRSDTLYGHLLWAAAEWDGDDAVAELIESLDSDAPPFRISSAFPAGMLPMPLLAPIKRAKFKQKFGGSQGELFENLQAYKKFRKLEWIPLSLWNGGALNHIKLFKQFKKNSWKFNPAGSKEEKKEFCKQAEQAHNSIDRRTGSVMQGPGGLYSSSPVYYGRGSRLQILVQADEPARFEKLMDRVALEGFGADRSTGKGQFEFRRDQDFDPAIFEGKGPLRLNLSVCSAMDCSEFAGYYKPFVKLGKVNSGYAQPSGPFKKPFLAFNEGSVFSKMPQGGYVLRGVHPNQKVVQVCLPLTVPVSIGGEP